MLTRAAPGLTLAALPVLLAACIYAPFDLGLDAIGRIEEATVIDGPRDRKVLMLRVDGEITDRATDDGILGPRPATTSLLRQELDLARADDSIKAVVLRINSPGGGVTASDIIHREIASFREETGRPVVAFLMDTAASGGYYVAQAADWIVATPTTVTGSIGVVAQIPNVHGLGEKIGVQVHTIISGEHKDLGNPFRPMRDEERGLIQGLIDRVHARFIDVVIEGRRPRPGRRGMTPAQVREAADGRVFLADEAEELGMIDEVAHLEQAVRRAMALASLDRARVVLYERKTLGGAPPTVYSERFAASGPLRLGRGDTNLLKIGVPAAARGDGPVLKYLWVPGKP